MIVLELYIHVYNIYIYILLLLYIFIYILISSLTRQNKKSHSPGRHWKCRVPGSTNKKKTKFKIKY